MKYTEIMKVRNLICYNRHMNLKDKKVLVTGSSSGIGEALAIACAQKGAIVLINYRHNAKGAEDVLKKIEQFSTGFIFQADLIEEKQIEKMFETIKDTVGSVDILINNAGHAKGGDFFDNDLWKDQFENIFFSNLHVTQHFLKQNEDSELRKILNISSYFGNHGTGEMGFFPYSIAKSAITSMTNLLAKRSPKVLVNAIAPGYVWTPPWEKLSTEEKKESASENFIERFIQPNEISGMATTILENDAMTGQIVTIDGGLFIKKIK